MHSLRAIAAGVVSDDPEIVEPGPSVLFSVLTESRYESGSVPVYVGVRLTGEPALRALRTIRAGDEVEVAGELRVFAYSPEYTSIEIEPESIRRAGAELAVADHESSGAISLDAGCPF